MKRRDFRLGVLLDIDMPLGDGRREASALSRHLLRSAACAEAAGYDGVFLPDRHGRPTTLLPSQSVNAAGVAAITESVSVGTYCSVLPLYNPMQFAEEWSSIDHLSGGRAIVSVGGGYDPAYTAFFGLDAIGPPPFRDAVSVLRRAWTEASSWSESAGAHVYQNVQLTPPPLRSGGPELWIAGHGAGSMRYAASIGAGVAADPFPMPVELWRDRLQEFRRRGKESPFAPGSVAMLRHLYVSDSESAVEEVLRNVCQPQFREFYERGLLKGRVGGDGVDMSVTRETALAGSVGECARRALDVAQDYELDWLIVKLVRQAHVDFEAELEVLEAFAVGLRACDDGREGPMADH